MQSNWDKAFGKKKVGEEDKNKSEPKNKDGTFLGTGNLMSTDDKSI